MAIVLSVI